MPMQSHRLAAPIAAFAAAASAAVYHVDFEAGDDARDGLTPATAWARAPGDPAAGGAAAKTALQPGDTVRFKGGVVYRGTVEVKASGAEGRPIVFDGNTDGTWGEGRAIVDGGEALTGWRRCASAAEAGGNPRWAEIFYTDIPAPKSFRDLNLCSADRALPISQHPNPEDPFWQENMSRFWTAPAKIVAEGMPEIAFEPGSIGNSQQPIANLLLGGRQPAVIQPAVGGAFTLTFPAPVRVAAVGFSQASTYPATEKIALTADGKDLLTVSLAKGKRGLQRFDLPAPVELRRLTVRLVSLHEGETGGWTKLNQLALLTPEGKDLLAGPDYMTFTDPAHLKGFPADWFDGMTFVVHAGNNWLSYLPVKGYDPATSTLKLGMLLDKQYKETRYCLVNSVRLIDQPGEYSVAAGGDAKTARVFLLPPGPAGGQPDDISRSVRAHGFRLINASRVVVRGFVIRRQNENAINVQGGADLVFRDCELTLVGGSPAFSASRADRLRVERLNVHENPGHCRGIILHTCTNSAVEDCRLARNTGTALDFYACTDSRVAGCTALDNRGMHANGLTFYVGNKNIVVERNYVRGGHAAVTVQQVENIEFRNNVLIGGPSSPAVGIWPTAPHRDIRFLHNVLISENPDSAWQVGLFSNARRLEGFVARNNIIGGVYSDHNVFRGQTFSHNLYTRVTRDQEAGPLGPDERVETDLGRVFADAANGDYRLREGSPAIGAGVATDVSEDFRGQRCAADRVDVGAYAFP